MFGKEYDRKEGLVGGGVGGSVCVNAWKIQGNERNKKVNADKAGVMCGINEGD